MKKLFIIFFFSVLSFSDLYAEWSFVVDTSRGDTFYADFDRLRKSNGFVYFWSLADFKSGKQKDGFLSAKSYFQGDCKAFRMKQLSSTNHRLPMGKDLGNTFTFEKPEWIYPNPSSVLEAVLEKVCNY